MRRDRSGGGGLVLNNYVRATVQICSESAETFEELPYSVFVV